MKNNVSKYFPSFVLFSDLQLAEIDECCRTYLFMSLNIDIKICKSLYSKQSKVLKTEKILDKEYLLTDVKR